MKKSTISITIFLLLITVLCNTEVVYSQDTTIAGKKLKIIKKSILSPGTVFYQLKNMQESNSIASNYIKVNNSFSKTSFSESELKGYINNGSMSSLGTLKTVKYKDSTLNYFIKNRSAVFFIVKSKSAHIWEFPLEVLNFLGKDFVAASNDDQPGGGGPSQSEKCTDHCEDLFVNCVEFPMSQEYCMDVVSSCLGTCEHNYPTKGTPERVLKYDLPTLSKLIKL